MATNQDFENQDFATTTVAPQETPQLRFDGTVDSVNADAGPPPPPIQKHSSQLTSSLMNMALGNKSGGGNKGGTANKGASGGSGGGSLEQKAVDQGVHYVAQGAKAIGSTVASGAEAAGSAVAGGAEAIGSAAVGGAEALAAGVGAAGSAIGAGIGALLALL